MKVEMKSLKAAVLLFAAGVIVVAGEVKGFSYWNCSSTGQKITWITRGISWRGGISSFSNLDYRTGLERANMRWNQAPGGFTFGIKSWSDTSLRRGNGQSEIWFSHQQSVLDGAPAICYHWFACFGSFLTWTEADVIFDAGEPYSPFTDSSGKWGYGGGNRPFVTTAIHELGHALGLGHENRTYNIMGNDWTHVGANWNYITEYAGEDATRGLLYLYGPSGQQPSSDVGVTHWKHSGAKGEYSTHAPTEIYDLNMNTVAWETSQGFRRYHVKAGQTYNVEFTIENNGKDTLYYVKTGYYVSTNNLITTSDTLLAHDVIWIVSPDWVWTRTKQITIPSSMINGQTYWFGIVVDRTGEIAEFNESNNATYLPILIVP